MPDPLMSSELIIQLKDACAKYDINASESVAALIATLDPIATHLAQNQILRERVGSDDPSVWTHLRKIWRDLVRTQLTFWDGDDSADEDDTDNTRETEKQKSLKALCSSIARLTRNLAAGVPANQVKAFENELDIRRLLHYYTSWTAMEDKEGVPVARLLAQTLANLITGNDALMQKLWDIHMNLPEDQSVLIRLLASKDSRTLLAALHLIRNCVLGSKSRTKMLTRTTIGARICVSLLDDMVNLYDAEEGTDGALAFDVGYEIFSRLMEVGTIPDLYAKLTMKDEIVTPHQTILLKLIDSYLQAAQLNPSATTAQTLKTHVKLSPILARSFFALSSYAQHAIRRSLGNNSPTSTLAHDTVFSPQLSPLLPNELDVMLPKVCEALVLVVQCIISITLTAAETPLEKQSPATGLSPDSETANLKDYFNNKRVENQGAVESLIELLRLLDLFLPRINFGKPVSSGRFTGDASDAQESSTAPDNMGFNYLKRDLVRLLGILCHETKGVQDRVRLCGGIEVVMNLCVVDERNPYLREHAIFTLSSLLKGNAENQAVVEDIKPSGQWGDDGMLRDSPNSTRK